MSRKSNEVIDYDSPSVRRAMKKANNPSTLELIASTIITVTIVKTVMDLLSPTKAIERHQHFYPKQDTPRDDS